MSTSHRSILHIDLDAFYVSVELLDRPELRGKPVAVGGTPDGRGVVASASYEARAYGVRSAMPMRIALQKCPDLIILSWNRGNYSEYSRKVMALFYEITPQVEKLSIDEAYLDVTGSELLSGTPEEIARNLKTRIHDEFGLPCSIGVASNKLVAKIATEEAKPNGIRVVAHGEEAAFLAPMPITRLWGIGPKAAETLHGMRIETIGQLAATPIEVLARRFSINRAEEMIRHAHGISTSEVDPNREAKSISQETTFARDSIDREQMRVILLGLSEGVGKQLRAQNVDARTIAIKLRYADFTTFSRQITLPRSTHLDQPIFDAAWSLFTKAWNGKPVRLLGVAARNLGTAAEQLNMFEPRDERDERLTQSIDKIKAKFGKDAVKRASLIKKNKK